MNLANINKRNKRGNIEKREGVGIEREDGKLGALPSTMGCQLYILCFYVAIYLFLDFFTSSIHVQIIL